MGQFGRPARRPRSRRRPPRGAGARPAGGDPRRAPAHRRPRPGAPTRVAAGLHDSVKPKGGQSHFKSEDRGGQCPFKYDLRVGRPDVGAFPRAGWVRALRRALAVAPDAALTHGDPRGRPELRKALAAYLGRTRGVLVDPRRIVVCSGFTQGLALLCRALGGTLAMEDPCLPELRAIARAAGVRIAALEVDERGARPEVPTGAGAALLTPAHQFPLGATLAP